VGLSYLLGIGSELHGSLQGTYDHTDGHNVPTALVTVMLFYRIIWDMIKDKVRHIDCI
jgi:hypothetical protein